MEMEKYQSGKEDNEKSVYHTEAVVKVESGPERFGNAEFIGTLVLATGGALIAKKFWDSNIGGVKEKFGDFADRVLESASKKAKAEIDNFLFKNNREIALRQLTNEVGGVSSLFEVVDKKAATKDVVVDESLSESDLEFNKKMQMLQKSSDESMIEFMRDLDPATRDIVSAAFLSSREFLEDQTVTIEEVKKEIEEMNEDEKMKLFMLFIEESQKIKGGKSRSGIDNYKLTKEEEESASIKAFMRYQDEKMIKAEAEAKSETDVESENQDLDKETESPDSNSRYEKLIREKIQTREKMLKMIAKTVSTLK